MVEGADILMADACEISALDEAVLSHCQVVVAATGDDKVIVAVGVAAWWRAFQTTLNVGDPRLVCVFVWSPGKNWRNI